MFPRQKDDEICIKKMNYNEFNKIVVDRIGEFFEDKMADYTETKLSTALARALLCNEYSKTIILMILACFVGLVIKVLR